MEVVPLSPVQVSSLRWRRDTRSWVLTLVAKLTFTLQPGEMRPAPQQDPLREEDQHWEDDPTRSLAAASDMAPFKPRADVLLVGHAFAPQGGRVRSLVARLACGSIDKTIAVYGDRAATRGEPAAFSRMALTYERAPRGPGGANPVGVPEGRMPNLEAMRHDDADHEATPVGFGPIAPGWPVRKARLQKHASFSPDEPLDDGLDPEFFNVAPPDQRLAALRNDEHLALDNLHPEHARLVTRLPGLAPVAFVERAHGVQGIDLRIDTLAIDTDRACVAVTWRGQLALTHRDEQSRVLVAVGDERQKLSYEDVKRLDPAHPAAPARTAAALPRLGQDDDDDEPNRSTVAMAVPPEIQAMRAARAAMPFVAAKEAPRRPATIPPTPPVPSHAGITGSTRAPADRRPPPRRSSGADKEKTSTELFVAGKEKSSTQIFIPPDQRAALDATPAWLAQSAPSPPRPPPPPPPAAPAAVQPPIAAPAPVPVAALSQASPAPAEAKSPWAAGAPSASVAPTIAHVPRTTAPVYDGAASDPKPVVRPAPARAEVLDLLWFDPPALPRIRSRFGAIVDELEFEPLDPRHDLPVDDPAASRDRHHAFGVLTRAEPTDARGVTRAMQEAVGERGQFTPPLVVLGGELRFLFDEVETLKVAAGAAKPLAKDDKKLSDLLESYAELLETPLLRGAPGVIDGLLKELQAAVQQAKRALPVKFLDAHVERVLLEQRSYQKRKVFGGNCIRALLTVGREGSSAIPAYLPESAADKLPLATEVRVRLVAEANQSQDQYETHPHALRIVVLGRVLGV